MNTIGPFPPRRSVGFANGRWRKSFVTALGALLFLVSASADKTGAFSILNISRDTNQFTTVTWESSTNYVFIVLSAGEISTDTVWVARTAMCGLEGMTCWTDTTTANVDRGFYRVVRVDPADDFDGDGMPDGWELRYGLLPLDPGDAHACIVCDGTDNLAKYLQGRDPTREAVADAGGRVNLSVFTPLE
jgi:hypothetical protein